MFSSGIRSGARSGYGTEVVMQCFRGGRGKGGYLLSCGVLIYRAMGRVLDVRYCNIRCYKGKGVGTILILSLCIVEGFSLVCPFSFRSGMFGCF